MLSRSVIGPEFNNYQGGEGQTVTLLGSLPVEGPIQTGPAEPTGAAPSWDQPGEPAAWAADGAGWAAGAPPTPGETADWAAQPGAAPGWDQAAGWQRPSEAWEPTTNGTGWEQPAAGPGAWNQPADDASRVRPAAGRAQPTSEAGWEQPAAADAWAQPTGGATRRQSGDGSGWEEGQAAGQYMEPHPYADYYGGSGAAAVPAPQPMTPQPPFRPDQAQHQHTAPQQAARQQAMPQQAMPQQAAPQQGAPQQAAPPPMPAPHPLPMPMPQPLPGGRAVQAPEAEYTDLASRAADLAARVASLVSANAGAEQSLERYETQTTNLSAFLSEGEGGYPPGGNNGFPAPADEGRAEAARRTAARFAGNSARARAAGQRTGGDDHSARQRNT
jgi:hypothetical protein